MIRHDKPPTEISEEFTARIESHLHAIDFLFEVEGPDAAHLQKSARLSRLLCRPPTHAELFASREEHNGRARPKYVNRETESERSARLERETVAHLRAAGLGVSEYELRKAAGKKLMGADGKRVKPTRRKKDDDGPQLFGGEFEEYRD